MKQTELRKKEDTVYRDLQERLRCLESMPCPVAHPVSPEQLYRYDIRMGRSTSYYALEEDALHYDLEYVVHAENIATVRSALEGRGRYIKREACRSFAPFHHLSDAQKADVLARLGLDRRGIDGPGPMPLDVGRYRIRLSLRLPDEYIPGKDVEEIFEEYQEVAG
ncbi:hypothetical protein, partial [Desulfofundulus sp.]|uniref:hypothetical protein n=1 Tax=Desulfofundulus sp. TaxID=2282750 RepID=UPI003C751A36